MDGNRPRSHEVYGIFIVVYPLSVFEIQSNTKG